MTEALLKVNARLRQLLAVCLTDGKGLSDKEMRLAEIILGDDNTENAWN